MVEVEQAARGALTGGFVSADLEALRSAVQGLAWVDRARVQRLWPDRIRIEVVEQQAAARWGEDGLLAGTASINALAIPVVAVLGAWIQLGEKPDLFELAGMLTIAAALTMVALLKARATTKIPLL
jgi:cell division septal protein FtsQ